MRNLKGQFVKGFGFWTGKKRPGLKTPTQFQKGHTPWSKGLKMPEEHCIKLGLSQRGVPKPNLRGEKSKFWKGGKTSETKKLRMSIEYKNWRRDVFERDNYTCQECGQHGGNLEADHIVPFSLNRGLRFDVNNGRTLCKSCHKKTDTYGRGKFYRLNVMPSYPTKVGR